MKTIYTHGGRFHLDEVMATAILLQIADFNIIRITDWSSLEQIKNNLNLNDYMLDIGREYDPERRLYDHHQEFLLRPDGFPYATAGLIWERFGQFLSLHPSKVDDSLIKGIDAVDADPAYTFGANCIAGGVQVLTLSSLIDSMNAEDVTGPEQMDRFEQAVELATIALHAAIDRAEAMVDAERVFSEGEFVQAGVSYFIFEEGFPWHQFVIPTEAEFVITPSAHPGSAYSVQAVPVKVGSRKLKRPIQRPSWFEGFLHNSQFIAGCSTLDQAVRLVHIQAEL